MAAVLISSLKKCKLKYIKMRAGQQQQRQVARIIIVHARRNSSSRQGKQGQISSEM